MCSLAQTSRRATILRVRVGLENNLGMSQVWSEQLEVEGWMGAARQVAVTFQTASPGPTTPLSQLHYTSAMQSHAYSSQVGYTACCLVMVSNTNSHKNIHTVHTYIHTYMQYLPTVHKYVHIHLCTGTWLGTHANSCSSRQVDQ